MRDVAYELFRTQVGNNMLRLYVFGSKTCLMINNLETNEGLSYDLSDKEIVDLGKALIKAWERNFTEEK